MALRRTLILIILTIWARQLLSCGTSKTQSSESTNNSLSSTNNSSGTRHTKQEVIPQVTEIDFTQTQRYSIQYFKYALLAFFRLLDLKFLRNIPPQSESLTKLESFSEKEPLTKKLWLETFVQLIRYGAATFKDYTYKATIDTANYLNQALLSRLIQWIRSKFDRIWGHYTLNYQNQTELLLDAMDDMIKAKNARNYLDEILPKDDPRKFVQNNYIDSKEERMKYWENYDSKEDEAALLLKRIGESSDISSLRRYATCQDIRTYDRIVMNSESVLFKKVFGKGQWETLRTVDIILKDVDNLFILAMSVTWVDLREFLVKSSMRIAYYKHVALVMAEAFTRKLLPDGISLDETIINDLKMYPVRYETFTATRYCLFDWWIQRLLENMEEKLKSTGGLKTIQQKAYFRMLLSWFKATLQEQLSGCQDTIAMIDKLHKTSTNVLRARDSFGHKDPNEAYIIDFDLEQINTLDDLLKFEGKTQLIDATVDNSHHSDTKQTQKNS